ncbi:hypothetical protein, partial [Parasutterella excrementihominis]|uniref:hypothetical protein n=1 Tax=Parasutterella excrementihominis TaxID=487175 RepID=UPI003AF1D40C
GFLQSEPRDSDLASGYVLGATARTSGLSPCRVRSCRAHTKNGFHGIEPIAQCRKTVFKITQKNVTLF